MRGQILRRCGLILALAAAATAPAYAQVPPDIAAQLRAIGPVIDAPAVTKIYAPLHADTPKDGVTRTDNVAYGPDERNRLDVYAPAARPVQKTPVLIFIHGGGFVRGDKAIPNTPFYANIGTYFARHGVLTVVATYRLAPKAVWPAGAKDIAAVVKWTRANAERLGGDPKRIVLWGHSAGAAHVAAYALDKRFQPKGGSGLAGAILMAGVYDPVLEAAAPEQFSAVKPQPMNEAYYGADAAKYADRSPLRHLTGPKLPVLLVVSELDPAMMHIETGAMFAALCRRDKQCPALLTPRDHDHISESYAINTPDESVSAPVLAFIQAH